MSKLGIGISSLMTRRFWVQAAEEAGRQVKRDDNSEERMEAEFLKPLINVGPF